MKTQKKIAGVPIFVWFTVGLLIGTVVAATVISNILTSTTTVTNHSQYWGTFYYPWYGDNSTAGKDRWRHWNGCPCNGSPQYSPPENWKSHFLPDDGTGTFSPVQELYSSLSATVINRHLTWMDDARFDFALVSWWGNSSFEDKAFHQMLIDARDNITLHLKLAAYYELEGPSFPQPTVGEIVGNLTYIYENRANFTSYFGAGPNQYPVVFVYGDPSDGFDYANRWSDAKSIMIGKGEPMFIVLKVFDGYTQNGNDKKVDGWYQYNPSVKVTSPPNCEPINCDSFPHYELQPGYSALATPGFWKYNESAQRLSRDTTGFAAAVSTLASLSPSRAQFLLIETFNEWHEGTQLEPGIPVNTDTSPFTPSNSTYGFDYLDIIKNRGR